MGWHVLTVDMNYNYEFLLTGSRFEIPNSFFGLACYGGGVHWNFRFCGFGYFLDRFFSFGVHCGLQIFLFLSFGFRFL